MLWVFIVSVIRKFRIKGKIENSTEREREILRAFSCHWFSVISFCTFGIDDYKWIVGDRLWRTPEGGEMVTPLSILSFPFIDRCHFSLFLHFPHIQFSSLLLFLSKWFFYYLFLSSIFKNRLVFLGFAKKIFFSKGWKVLDTVLINKICGVKVKMIGFITIA